MSGLSSVAARPPPPIAVHPSAPPPSASSLSPSHWLFLPAHSMPAPVCQLSCHATVLFKVLHCKIKKFFFIFCICFLYIICVKTYYSTVQYSWLLLVGYLGKLCWAYIQIGLNVLSEQNSLACRGLTVLINLIQRKASKAGNMKGDRESDQHSIWQRLSGEAGIQFSFHVCRSRSIP